MQLWDKYINVFLIWCTLTYNLHRRNVKRGDIHKPMEKKKTNQITDEIKTYKTSMARIYSHKDKRTTNIHSPLFSFVVYLLHIDRRDKILKLRKLTGYLTQCLLHMSNVCYVCQAQNHKIFSLNFLVNSRFRKLSKLLVTRVLFYLIIDFSIMNCPRRTSFTWFLLCTMSAGIFISDYSNNKIKCNFERWNI